MARQIIDLPEMNDEQLSADDLLVVRDKDEKKDKRMTMLSLVDFFYPVGQIWTNDLVDPNDRFPGTTWEKVEAKFIISSGSGVGATAEAYTFNVGDEGGEFSHKLTIAEMPSHNHNFYTNEDGYSGSASAIQAGGDNAPKERLTNSVGGGFAHNNLPPFRVSQVWVRTE